MGWFVPIVTYVAVSVVFVACDTGGDDHRDAAADVDADTVVDASVDAGADVDAYPDVTVDAGRDADVDAGRDTGLDGDGDDQGDGGDSGPAMEMLLFDGDGRRFTAEENGFHAVIEPGDALPAANWLDPVDYYNGEFHVRYVISSPPEQAAGMLQTCIWTMGDDGLRGDYFPESCGQQVAHSGVGEHVVTNSLTPAEWWTLDGVPVDYSHPERFLVRVVLRGESGCNVTTYDVGGSCWDQWPSYENMTFRVTIVMVGAGETFSGWASYP